jgi:type I restriction enzyme S subunit
MSTYGDVFVERVDRGESRTHLPILSVTKSRGPMLASERFGKPLHGKDLAKYRVAYRNDVVADPMLLWDGSIGIQRVVDAGLVSPDYRVYAHAPNGSPEFLAYLVRSPGMLPFYQGGARGTNVRRNRIARSDFLRIPFALPPLGEQRKIAAILSSVDDAIEATQAVIDQLQVVKKAMMAELLTRGLPGRHTRFKMTEIGEIPEEWEVVRIDTLGPDTGACVRSGPFGSSMKTSDFRKTGTPVLTIQSLGEGTVLRGGLFYVDEAKTRELAEYSVRPNDLVFSRVADIGRCVAVGPAETGWLISPNLSRIRLDPRKADAAFLMYCLTAESPVRRQIRMLAGDAGRPVISSGTLKAVAIPLPTPAEQALILSAGRQLEHRLVAEKEALEGARALKSALMSVLLTGEVRVKPDEGAPA